ncbi:MAG: hypothetical protein J5750_02610 [Clostridiales bacterium]|nr:hypothetical protein [Clostridiales bacterium]
MKSWSSKTRLGIVTLLVVMRIGNRTLIKRKIFEQYIDQAKVL